MSNYNTIDYVIDWNYHCTKCGSYHYGECTAYNPFTSSDWYITPTFGDTTNIFSIYNSDYDISDMDAELRDRLTKIAKDRGITIKELVLEMLEEGIRMPSNA